MPVHTIPLDALSHPLPVREDQLRSWCAQLEAGAILYFPQTPVPIPEADLNFLLAQPRTAFRLHKNIAYKPDRDKLSGVDKKWADATRMIKVMRRYSAGAPPGTRLPNEYLSYCADHCCHLN